MTDQTADEDTYPDRVEAARARADFQREVYRTRDSRIASADGTGSALAATAAAIALAMHEQVFETWRAMTESAQGREAVKRRLAWLVLAPIGAQVVIFGLGIRQAR